jgi:hypothetical protein
MAKTMAKLENRKRENITLIWGTNHFGGGLCTKLIPFSMFPFRSALQASRSSFSSELMCGMGFVAFSAPEGYP